MAKAPVKTVAICDNDNVFASQLRDMLIDLAGQTQDASFRITILDSTGILSSSLSSIDVLFLCIDLPGAVGVELASIIRQRCPHLMMILLSNSPIYAPTGYRLNIFRFLLKNQIAKDLSQCFQDMLTTVLVPGGIHVTVDRNYSTTFALSKIMYLEGTSQRKIIFHTQKGQFSCIGKLADYEKELCLKGFLRIQRSFLVNMEYIKSINNYWALLINGEKLKTTVKHYSEICSSYRKWKGQSDLLL